MRARRLVPLLLSLSLTGAMTATSAQAVPSAPSVPTASTAPSAPTASSASPDALVRITGELVSTAVETAGGPQWFAVRAGNQLIPISGDQLAGIAARSTVTLDVTVPDDVVDAAAADTTISIPSTGGRLVQHDLTPADLDSATDGTPATAGSPIGEATIDTPLAPGADPLPVAEVVTAKATAAAYTPATRVITYMEVTPKGATRSPVSSASAIQQVANTDSFWRDNSRSTLKIGAPTIKSHYTSPYTCGDPFGMWNDAAVRVGWTPRANASLVLKLPESASPSQGCSWGLGTVGMDPNDWGLVYTSSIGFSVLAHELGHNMSLGHADALHCTGRSDAALSSSGTWSNDCQEEPYADYIDVMGPDTGGGSAMLSSPQAVLIGTLEPAARVTVGPGTRTLTLAPMSGLTGVRTAVVHNAVTKTDYYVEYRPASGRDRGFDYFQSSGVKVLRYNPEQQSSVLLDPTPSGYRDSDPVLTAGKTLTSHDRRVKITTVSTSAAGAVVRIENTATLRPFTNTALPTITGTKGVGTRLTASKGTWSPTPTSYSYRWKRNGTTISGATSSRYTPTTSDAGRYLTVTVTARRSGYTSKSATSKRVGIPIYATTRPSIVGTAKSGRTLTTKVGTWTPRPTSYSYQWYRNGAAISGAQSRTYKVNSRDRGRKIQVRVTAKRSGYSTGSMRSYSKTIAR